MKVSVITSAYNRVSDLIVCIDSIQRSLYRDYEVIVVDNASTDGTSEILREKYGTSINLITLSKNCFSAGGKNAGIGIAKGEYLWFVDSDMVVSEELMECLSSVLDNDKRIGMVGARIYYYNDKERIWSNGSKISLITSMSRTINESEVPPDDLVEIPIILCGYMVRREVIEKIGRFDEHLKIVFEEADLAKKIHNSNYKIVLATKLKIFHNVELPEKITDPLRKNNLDNPDRAYFFARNRSLYMKRHAKWYGKACYFTLWIHLFCLYYIYKSISFGRRDIAKAYFRGYINGIKEGQENKNMLE